MVLSSTSNTQQDRMDLNIEHKCWRLYSKLEKVNKQGSGQEEVEVREYEKLHMLCSESDNQKIKGYRLSYK